MAQDTLAEYVPTRQHATPLRRLINSQPFWVTVAVIIITVGMGFIEDASFTGANFFNITRNFAFIAIMALGQAAVIITGGIDLSVGSVLGLCGIVLGLVMSEGHSFYVAVLVTLLVGALCGAINGGLIAYVRLSPFVVTLGMLSIARSAALVVSNNKFFHEFGADESVLIEFGGGATWGIANPVIVCVLLTAIMALAFRFTVWGRHIYAIGGNEQAARLTGVPVDRVKMSVYILSGVMAAISAILTVGWMGPVTNGLGIGYELRVIASTVIGGANLMGGEGGAYGAFIGAALIELIRNSLLMAGVDPYWQGAFVGLFIILAVLLERIRGIRSK